MIHSSSIIEAGAKLGENVKIGPFCSIGKDVVLEDGVELISHVSISGNTFIGKHTKIFPFASIGHAPQDLKYSGENSRTIIGCNNSIREYVTIQPGTSGDKMETVVGDNCLLMVNSHVAHDCVVKNNVVMANNATLAGHVSVGNYAIIGGLAAIKQFVRIGDHAIIGGMAGVESDVIPFGMVIGERAWLNGINLVGLKRRGFDTKTIKKLQEIYSILFSKENTISSRIKIVAEQYNDQEDVKVLINFLQEETSNPLCQPKK